MDLLAGHRPYTLISSAFDSIGPLHVEAASITESISGLYSMQLSVFSEKRDIPFKEIIGQKVALRINIEEGILLGGEDDGPKEKVRFIHGYVSRFSQGPMVEGFATYQAEVVPWLWYLTRASDSQIFQEMTIPEIVMAVFDSDLFADIKAVEDQLTGSYPIREYCVQYRETHFNFVMRLLEEAGIAFYFKHEEDAHTLVLFDDPSSSPEVEFGPKARYDLGEEDARSSGEISNWVSEEQLPTGKYVIDDYNFKDPNVERKAEGESRLELADTDRFEIYEYPGEYVGADPGGDIDAGAQVAKARIEAEDAASLSITASGPRCDFAPGYKFELVDHYRDDFNQEYLITSVTHQIATSGIKDFGEAGDYSNSFSCIPHKVAFRPLRRTPKPIISGAQTAVVVGAEGEEIDVDEFGRVVVKFHWDRVGANDATASCRIRVSQSMAGAGFGGVLHPRIGQEVIVEFIEGDPDRPIITGRVYNGANDHPYSLPDNKSQSGLKTRSTTGATADNFNEIRFEDKAGSELLFIQAEKDHERLVKNDEHKQIGANQKEEVGDNRDRSVGSNETVSVGSNQTVTIAKEHQQDVGANQTLAVGGDRQRSVAGKEEVDVGKDQSVSVTGDRNLRVSKSQTIAVSKDQQESVGDTYTLEVGKDHGIDVGKKMQINVADELRIKVGQAEIVMKKNGDIVLQGGKIQLKGKKDVIIKGSKIGQN